MLNLHLIVRFGIVISLYVNRVYVCVLRVNDVGPKWQFRVLNRIIIVNYKRSKNDILMGLIRSPALVIAKESHTPQTLIADNFCLWEHRRRRKDHRFHERRFPMHVFMILHAEIKLWDMLVFQWTFCPIKTAGGFESKETYISLWTCTRIVSNNINYWRKLKLRLCFFGWIKVRQRVLWCIEKTRFHVNVSDCRFGMVTASKKIF